MDIVKITGVGIIALIIIIIIKQYKPEFAVYVSITAGIIILFLVLDKLYGVINLLINISNKTGTGTEFIGILLKITRYCNTYRICSKYL